MFEKVLVAVDGSGSSEKALQLAGELARLSGGEVVVCHVTEFEPEMSRGGMDPGEQPATGQALVDRSAKTLADSGLSVSTDLRHSGHSHVAAEILEAARAKDADVIVMGTRGLSEASAMVMGSITHKVLHLADRPVVIAR